MELTESERRWIKRKWQLIREANVKADKANAKWAEINEAIKVKHAREDEALARQGRPPLTDLMKAKDKEASLPLKDSLSTGSWHSRNAERHIHDVNLFLRLRELGIQ